MAERESSSAPTAGESTPIRGGDRHARPEATERVENRPTTTDSYAVVLSFGWVVRGAKTGQDAINIAVSEVGKRVGSPSEPVRTVDISVQQIGCHSCGTGSEALLLVAETALVGLFLEVVVNAEDPVTAENIARREVGPHLDNTPLASVDIAPADSEPSSS